MRDWLREIRQNYNLNQKEVALLCGCSRNIYNMIERDKRRPSPELAQKLGNALGFDWTIFYTQNSNETTPLTYSKM